MEEKKVTKKEIMYSAFIGLGVFASCCVGAWAGYKLAFEDLGKASWRFDILNNTNLRVSIKPENSKKYFWLKFSGKDTKTIVDTLMDDFYPGD